MFALIAILFSFFSAQPDNFDAQLKKYLDSQLSGYVKYEYQYVKLRQNYVKIEIDEEKKSRLSKNYLYVPVRIYDSKNQCSASVLSVKLKLFKNIYVALKEITRNEILNHNNFLLKPEDVSMYENYYVSGDNRLENFRSNVVIKAGSTLMRDMIDPVPLINRGDKVYLHTGDTGVDISVEVTARQDGRAGDVISVSAGSKLYKGKIIGRNKLTLVE